MIWAGISKKGNSELLFVEVNLNAQAYTTMITNYLLPFIEENPCGEDQKAIFQQDNAPACPAVLTKECFFRQYCVWFCTGKRSPRILMLSKMHGLGL